MAAWGISVLPGGMVRKAQYLHKTREKDGSQQPPGRRGQQLSHLEHTGLRFSECLLGITSTKESLPHAGPHVQSQTAGKPEQKGPPETSSAPHPPGLQTDQAPTTPEVRRSYQADPRLPSLSRSFHHQRAKQQHQQGQSKPPKRTRAPPAASRDSQLTQLPRAPGLRPRRMTDREHPQSLFPASSIANKLKHWPICVYLCLHDSLEHTKHLKPQLVIKINNHKVREPTA